MWLRGRIDFILRKLRCCHPHFKKVPLKKSLMDRKRIVTPLLNQKKLSRWLMVVMRHLDPLSGRIHNLTFVWPYYDGFGGGGGRFNKFHTKLWSSVKVVWTVQRIVGVLDVSCNWTKDYVIFLVPNKLTCSLFLDLTIRW